MPFDRSIQCAALQCVGLKIMDNQCNSKPFRLMYKCIVLPSFKPFETDFLYQLTLILYHKVISNCQPQPVGERNSQAQPIYEWLFFFLGIFAVVVSNANCNCNCSVLKVTHGGKSIFHAQTPTPGIETSSYYRYQFEFSLKFSEHPASQHNHVDGLCCVLCAVCFIICELDCAASCMEHWFVHMLSSNMAE